MTLTFNKLNHRRLKKHRREQRKFKKSAYEYRSHHISPTKEKKTWDKIFKIAKENGW